MIPCHCSHYTRPLKWRQISRRQLNTKREQGMWNPLSWALCGLSCEKSGCSLFHYRYDEMSFNFPRSQITHAAFPLKFLSSSFFTSLIARFPQIRLLSLNFSSEINKTFVFYYCVNYTDRGLFEHVSSFSSSASSESGIIHNMAANVINNLIVHDSILPKKTYWFGVCLSGTSL